MCWTLGTSRRTTQTSYVHFNDGWINTDAIVNDVRTTGHLFAPIITPNVGCIVVYPHDVALGRHYGHVGVVTAIDEDKVARVIHCSHTNYVKTLDAIQDTPPWVGGFLCAAAIYATYIGDRVPSALVSAAALRG